MANAAAGPMAVDFFAHGVTLMTCSPGMSKLFVCMILVALLGEFQSAIASSSSEGMFEDLIGLWNVKIVEW
jgi:hypothetical protein